LSNGDILIKINPNEIKDIAKILRRENIESVAVVYIFSFLNPYNEKITKEVLRNELSNVYLSLSSEVAPIIREYERTSTTVINAFIGPLILKYINKLTSVLNELGFKSERFYVMQSNGGLLSPKEVLEKPVYILESGPVAGISAARWLSSELGIKDVISFDMGGTTAKAAVIKDGEPLFSNEFWIEDKYFVAIPHIDLVEVGAGGGSIAWTDKFGALRIGPQSVGSNPGPICYDRGGIEPTITDANLILGYMILIILWAEN
jgi:N-methylhydantoinase A